MIGAVVYRLQAENSAWLPMVHGRFMHAAFFAALRDLSPELSGYVHDEMNSKPFTVSELELPLQKLPREGRGWRVKQGTEFFWRVTALQDTLLQALFALPAGYELLAGGLRLQLMEIIADPERHADSGIIDENDLIAGCLQAEDIREITFEFWSPVSFRFFDKDYPWPLPGYVFASIADKWSQNQMPVELNREEIREEAGSLFPMEWEGRSRRVFFAANRGVLGFEGRFTYDLQALPVERRQLYLMLAQYAVFSGVGRMTAQGMGQTRIIYR